jgi:hypothetical protein
MTVVKLSGGRTLNREQTLSAIRNKNAEVIKEITTGDFQDGGRLNRQQFAEFYQEVIDESNVLDRVRRVPVDGPESQIDRIGVGERLLREVGENSSVTDQSDTIDSSKVDIDVTKVGFGWDLSRETVEDTIEYENTAQIILSQFSSQYQFDLETLAFQGDTDATLDDGSGDPHPFYSILDGWIVEAESDGAAVDDDGATDTLTSGHLFDLTYNIEDKYLNATDPVFFAHPKQVMAYRQDLAERETSLGDSMLTTDEVPTPTGYPIVPSTAVQSDTVVFTDPMNLAFAPHRDMRVDVTTESEKVVKNDLFAQYGVTSRIDFAVEQGEAVSIIENMAEPTA